jgi:hypothetical protein
MDPEITKQSAEEHRRCRCKQSKDIDARHTEINLDEFFILLFAFRFFPNMYIYAWAPVL